MKLNIPHLPRAEPLELGDIHDATAKLSDPQDLIKREAEKAKRSLEDGKAEAEAKHLAEKAAKAARPIQIASFEL